MCPWTDVCGRATTHGRSAFLSLSRPQRPVHRPARLSLPVCLTSFPTSPALGPTGCLLPQSNMRQIRETSACLFFKREVPRREHNHSIVPLEGDGWVEKPQQQQNTHIRMPPPDKLAPAQSWISCDSGGAAGSCIPYRVASQCSKTGRLG